jgi:hypothetical protein
VSVTAYLFQNSHHRFSIGWFSDWSKKMKNGAGSSCAVLLC